MKNYFFILAIVVCSWIAYWSGQSSGNETYGDNSAKKEIAKQADGLLAYAHYYECAEKLLKDVKIDANSENGKDFALAKKQLDDYYNNVVMEWPEICDQRDKLSDAIRAFADNHPEFLGNKDHDIFAYVARAGVNPDNLPSGVYAYQ